MWHEARKQEKKIRGIMIDHKRRAERRREFYESIRLDPAFYLQIHGQQMKVHIDAAISQAADSSLMPWMGDETNLIDRFDVRAHLDYIPTSSDVHANNHHSEEGLLTEDQECQLNYERYRNLVQNDFLDTSEQATLQRIYLKERCGDQNNVKSKSELKKKLADKKAAIGYNYDNSVSKSNRSDEESESSEGDDEEEFVDLDTTVNANTLDPDMLHRLNTIAKKYGIKKLTFSKFLESDKFESDKMKIAKEIESEKSLFAGRKSRRERRELFHQRMLILRSMTTDTSLDHFGSEAGVVQPKKSDDSDSSEDDDEASNGPAEEGKIEFITSFGGDSGEDDEEKAIRRRMKKLEKKRQEERKKEVKKKIKQIKNDEGTSTATAVMYGPTLPSTSDKQLQGGKSIHFTGSNSQRKRHYRYQNSDHENDSPVRRVRRSPSVRRETRRSSEDSDYSQRRKRRRSRSGSRPRRRSSKGSRPRRRSRSGSRSRRRSPSYHSRSRRHSRSRSRSRARRHRRRSSSSSDRSRSRSRSRSHRRSRRSKSAERRRRSRSRSFRKSFRDSHRRRKSRSRSHQRRSRYDSSSDSSPLKRYQSNTSRRNSNKSPSVTQSKLLNRNLELKKELESVEPSKVESNIDSDVTIPLPPSPDPTIAIVPPSPNPIPPVPEVEMAPLPLPIEALLLPPPAPPEVEELPPPPVKRYYRHDLDSDSDGLSDDESKAKKSVDSGEPRPMPTSSTGVTSTGASTQIKPNATNSKGVAPITPQERIRRLMQAQLDKQFKLDKKAESDKLEKKRLEQMEREKLTNKLESKRRRARSRSRSISNSSRSSRSSSRSSHSPQRVKRSRHLRSRSRDRRYRRSGSISRRHSRRRRDRSSS